MSFIVLKDDLGADECQNVISFCPDQSRVCEV